jgi:phosphoenolpyruvate carboxykinase (ATP)
MRIDHTRTMVRAALSGALSDVPYETDPVFGVDVPTTVPGVPSTVLRPRDTWTDPAAYDAKAHELAAMFAENFEDFADGVSEAVRNAGPRVEARPARQRRTAEAEEAPSD